MDMTVSAVLRRYHFRRKHSHNFPRLIGTICLLCGGIVQAQQSLDSNSIPAARYLRNPYHQLPEVARVTRGGKTSEGIPDTTKGSRSEFPPVLPPGRRVIGIALQGGGALGLAHIGVLQWLEDHHVPIDRIAGTSMGCLVGALEASAHTPQEMKELATNGDIRQVFALQPPFSDLSFRRKQDRIEIPQAVTLGLRRGVSLGNALLVDEGLNNFLAVSLNSYEREDLSFDSMPTPLRCVATDLNTLMPVVFREGSLPFAVRASISIPGVFSPVSYHGHFLVDGATVNNLPSDIVRNDLGSDVVIAVHLEGSPLAEGDVSSILGLLTRVYTAGVVQTERAGVSNADLVVNVATSGFSTLDYAKGQELIAAGYKAAEDSRAKLKIYALSESDWAQYEKDRLSRRLPTAGLLRVLKVDGGTDAAQRSVHRNLQSLQGQPISSTQLVKGLKRVQEDGEYSAVFATFTPSQRNAGEDHTGVHVALLRGTEGPPYLLIGPTISATSGNVTQTTLNLRLINQNLGGYGSELKADLRLGYLTNLSTEYHRSLNSNGLFIQPKLDLLRKPVYIWANQKRVAERFEQDAGGAVEIGFTINPHLQVAAEWRAQVVRWWLKTGSDNFANISGAMQTALMHLTFDRSEAGILSPNGFRIDASVGALYEGAKNPVVPVLHLDGLRTTAWRTDNIIGIGASADTYFRSDVGDPYRFTLGGPLRLSASSLDEYRGTDDYLVRAGYLRRVATLPSGIGHGIYTSFLYEAGEIWSTQRNAILREDVSVGVVAVTPFGVVRLGAALGDAGRRKVYFTLGRIF